MMTLNEIEIQNVRFLIGENETNYQKLMSYAKDCTDSEVKQLFQKMAQEALVTKRNLTHFLMTEEKGGI